MKTEQDYRDAVLAVPLSNRPRLAYADWVAPMDPTRAELIRLQIELHAQEPLTPALRHKLEDAQFHELELLDAHQERWSRGIDRYARNVVFGRGFIEEVELDAADLMTWGRDRLADEPLAALLLRALEAVDLAELLAHPLLVRLLALDLRDTKLGAAEARQLAAATTLKRLRSLDLRGNPDLNPSDIEIIRRSPHLANLMWMGVDGRSGSSSKATRREWWQLVVVGADLPPLRTLGLSARLAMARVKALQPTGTLLLASGTLRGDRIRMGLFERTPSPSLLLDFWLPLREIEDLTDQLRARGPLEIGGWAPIFDMQWARLWVPDPFHLWERGGHEVHIEADQLRLGHVSLPMALVEEVEGRISPDGILSTLEIRVGEDRHEIWTSRNVGAEVDPTYSPSDREQDQAALLEMGHLIAQGLGLSFREIAPSTRDIIRGMFRRDKKGAAWVLATHAPIPTDLAADPRWNRFTLHRNPHLPWPALLASDFEVDHRTLSQNKGHFWNEKLLDRRADLWDWTQLSRNPSLPWSPNLVAHFGDRWDWKALSGNPALPWSPALLRRFQDRWFFTRLAANRGVPWDHTLVRTWLSRLAEPDPAWDPRMEHERPEAVAPGIQLGPTGLFHLQQNPGVDWQGTLELIEDPNWNFLSANEGFPWTPENIRAHAEKINWTNLASNPAVPWTPALVDELWDHCFPWPLSSNPSLPWTPELLARFEGLSRWNLISRNPSVPWTVELLERYGDRLDWEALSKAGRLPVEALRRYAPRLDWNWGTTTNRSLPWTQALLREHQDRWNWERLAYNTALPWSDSLVAAFPQRWVIRSFERHDKAWTAIKEHLDEDFIRSL